MADSTETYAAPGGRAESAPPEAQALQELASGSPGRPLDEYVYESRMNWLRLWDAWLVVGLAFIEMLLAFRLGFLLAAANAQNGFVDLIYGLSKPLAAPFNGIVAGGKVGASGVFEPSILVAMAVYFVGAILLMSIAWAITTTEQAREVRPYPASPSARDARL
jgi:hypothetical protein